MSRHAIRSDLYDILAYALWSLRFRPLADLSEEGSEVLPNFPFLLEDIFRALYKEFPEFKEDVEIAEKYRVQKKVLEALTRLNWFPRLREETELNEEKAIIATETIGRMLLEMLRGEGKTPQPGEEPGMERLAQLLRALLRELEERGREVSQPLEEALDQMEERASEEAKEAIDGLKQGFGPSVYYFTDDLKEFEEALSWTQELRRFARALGRLSASRFRKRLEKAAEGAEEIYDVEMGRDLARLLPYELVKLAEPALSRIFWLDFIQRKLLTYKLTRRMPLGRGSKIFLIDLSGSTHGTPHVRQALEKLIALALTLYSKKGRAFGVLYFHTAVETLFLDNPPTTEQWLDLATRWGKGGTSFPGPLRQAVKLIETKDEFRKADIIFLTDGEAHISDEFVAKVKEMKRVHKFSLVTILIDWLGTVREEHVLKISDAVLKISELLSQKELEEITHIYTGGS